MRDYNRSLEKDIEQVLHERDEFAKINAKVFDLASELVLHYVDKDFSKDKLKKILRNARKNLILELKSTLIDLDNEDPEEAARTESRSCVLNLLLEDSLSEIKRKYNISR